ncbi:hypothetical protein [Hymenobacter sp. 5414T-23]|uniref:hypothetical protein n=1 Tax=Hymenobacter sp. 5414T-23 TaxID=2932252 RepID=UPI001FD5C7FA|nr:hypothetical protein [Hymenobacter sp. 5414T-23]UOQ82971.1 hypothetical protein MUN83_09515 [Hymenobacter sp. 5414T-23]
MIDWAGLINYSDKIVSSFLSGHNLYLIKLFSIVATILFISLGYLFRGSIKNACCALVVEFKILFLYLKKTTLEINAANKTYILFLFIVLLGMLLYQVKYLPLGYDEIWTWLNFASRGILVSIAYYPAPNNHILYSVLSSITFYLDSGVVGLRLPSFLAALVLFWILLIVLYRLFKSNYVAVIGVCLFFSFYMIDYYSMNARGYIYITLAFVGSTGALIELSKQKPKLNYMFWLGFVAFSVIGFASIPTYLYAFVSQALVFLFLSEISRKRKMTIAFIYYSFIVGVFVLLFYAPVLLISGFESVLKNKYVLPLPRQTVLSMFNRHVTQTARSFFVNDAQLYFFMILSVAGIVVLFVRKKHLYGFVLMGFVLLPFVFMYLQAVIPFPRTWVYLIFIIVIGQCVVLKSFEDIYIVRVSLISVLTPIFFIYFIYANMLNIKRYKKENALYSSIKKSYDIIVVNKKQLVIDSDFVDVYLNYFFVKNKIYYNPVRLHAIHDLDHHLQDFVWIHDKNSSFFGKLNLNKKEVIYNDSLISVARIMPM